MASKLTFALVSSGVLLSILAACSSPATGELGAESDNHTAAETSNTVTTTTGLPCDVDAVLKTRCQTCHAAEPKYGASTSLVTWDDLQKPAPGATGKKLYQLVADRISAESSPMPPSPQPRLAGGDLSTVTNWISSGAKSATGSCTNQAPTESVKPLSCSPDTHLRAKTPFTMKPGGGIDQYTCFGFDVKVDQKRHVTALAPVVDNKELVHHILLFQTTTSESPEPFACQAFGSAAWKLVAGWAPGGNNLELPPEAGFPENKGTTHWVVQIHYNTTKTDKGTDASGYDLCTTDQLRPNDAGVLAFGSTSFSIPPRANHKIRCDYRLDGRFAGKKIFNASPHMHTQGASMTTERLIGGKGTPEMVYGQEAFSFEAQANTPIAKEMNSGDIMRTRCGWKNATDQSIGFGEGTGDEMCFNFMGYYPMIPDQTFFGLPIFTWVTPSLNAACVPEP